MDILQRRPLRRADSEAAIPFDDEGDGAAFGADEFVDLDGHNGCECTTEIFWYAGTSFGQLRLFAPVWLTKGM